MTQTKIVSHEFNADRAENLQVPGLVELLLRRLRSQSENRLDLEIDKQEKEGWTYKSHHSVETHAFNGPEGTDPDTQIGAELQAAIDLVIVFEKGSNGGGPSRSPDDDEELDEEDDDLTFLSTLLVLQALAPMIRALPEIAQQIAVLIGAALLQPENETLQKQIGEHLTGQTKNPLLSPAERHLALAAHSAVQDPVFMRELQTHVTNFQKQHTPQKSFSPLPLLIPAQAIPVFYPPEFSQHQRHAQPLHHPFPLQLREAAPYVLPLHPAIVPAVQEITVAPEQLVQIISKPVQPVAPPIDAPEVTLEPTLPDPLPPARNITGFDPAAFRPVDPSWAMNLFQQTIQETLAPPEMLEMAEAAEYAPPSYAHNPFYRDMNLANRGPKIDFTDPAFSSARPEDN